MIDECYGSLNSLGGGACGGCGLYAKMLPGLLVCYRPLALGLVLGLSSCLAHMTISYRLYLGRMIHTCRG